MSTTDVELVRPDISLRENFIRVVDDYARAGDHEYANNYESAKVDFSAYIQSLRDDEDISKLKPGYVPQSWFWLITRNHDIAGISRLRHGLSPSLELEGGHIGYDVPPSMRQKGYGTILLRKTLLEAKKMGLERVLLTVNDDNPGSIGIIEHNGGQPAGSVISPKSGKTNLRYWIDL